MPGVQINSRNNYAAMVILNPYKQKVKVERDLPTLLGIDHRLQEKNLISRFTSFDAYVFPCDLLDEDENLLNGEPSSVLAYFDIVESQF